MSRLFPSLLILLLAAGCERAPTVRRYQEIAAPAPATPAAPAPGMNAAPAGPVSDMASTPVATAGTRLQWTAPAGWLEQGGSQMRLVTFRVGADGAECSITMFPGEVGGLEANLRRWLGQLKVQVAEADVARFARTPVTFQSEGNLPCLVYDFAELMPADKPESLLAAVIPLDGNTAFVKFGGARALLAAEKENFMALCRSLRP